MQPFELVTSPAALVSVLVLVLVQIIQGLAKTSKVPEGVPWVGKDAGRLFAETRAHLGSFSKAITYLTEGYQKVGALALHCYARLTSFVVFEKGQIIHYPLFLRDSLADNSPFSNPMAAQSSRRRLEHLRVPL